MTIIVRYKKPLTVASAKALRFPSNETGQSQTSPLVGIKVANPRSNGLPPAGPGNAGVTYIWRVKYRQQTGYYVLFWHGQGDGGFNPAKAYYGCHPYPTTANNTGTVHNWEIAAEAGDFQTTRAGGVKQVVKDVWFTQGLRVDYNGGAPKLIFYTDLPSTANADVIERTMGAGYLDAANDPPGPVLIFGDSPWKGGYQEERLSGAVSHLKIFSTLKSEADMLTEAANLNTIPTGTTNLWYWKNNFETVDDLSTDAGGSGPAFVYHDTANKCTLETL